MGRNVIIVTLVGIVGLGLFLSIQDWREWRYEEMKNYGHGPGELYAPAELFSEHFQNQFVGIKFNYPGSWGKTTNNKFENVNPKVVLADVLKVGQMDEVVKFEQQDGTEQEIIVWVGEASENTNLVDVVNVDIEKMKQEATVVGERQYIGSDRGNWTVVNYIRNGKSYKKAYLISGLRRFEIGFEYDSALEMKVLKTYEELLKNIIII